MTDGIELNGGQSEITEVPSSESENELVEWPTVQAILCSMETPFPEAFDLLEKNPSVEAQRRWRDAVQLVRNRPRRFRYARNLEKQAKEQMEISRIARALKMHMIEAKGTWSDQSLAPSLQDLYGLPEDTKLSKQKSKGTWSDQSLPPSLQDLYGLPEDTKLSKQKSKGTWSDQSLPPFLQGLYGLPEDTKLSKQKSKGTWSDQNLAHFLQGLDGLPEDTKLSKQKSKGTWSDQSLALLITVMSLFAGAAYMVLFSFHDAFPISAKFKGVVNLSILELLTFPRTATDDFLVIATVTTTFMLSMGMNTIAVCIFFRKFMRGTFLTILSLFTIVAFSVSFFAMLSKFFPHHITIAGGNLKIPATAIVIFYDIYVIILVCAFAYTVHRWQSSRPKQDAVTEPESKV